MIIENNGVKYQKCFQRVTWNGGINGTFRTLEFKCEDIYSNFKVGDKISFKLENTDTLFKGRVFSVSKTANSSVVTVKAVDNGIYLNRNHFVKNFYNKVPSEIVKEICGELKLDIGRLPQDTVKCTFPAIDRTGYEILLMAYTIQHNKDKKVYSVACNKDKIEILDETVMLETELTSYDNIRDTVFRTDLDRMVNQVVIYKTDGNNGQIIDKVANEENKSKYGLFQEVLQYNEDMNNILNARDMLKGLNERATVVVDGNVNLQAGYTVAIKEERTGLYGTFLIAEDTHTWKDGDYESRIELVFEKAMDKIALETERSKREKKEETYKFTNEKLSKEYEEQK